MRLSKLGTQTEAIVSPLASLPVDYRSANFDGDEIGLIDSSDKDFSCGGDFTFANSMLMNQPQVEPEARRSL